MDTVAAPPMITPPQETASPARAAGLPLIKTVLEPPATAQGE